MLSVGSTEDLKLVT